MNVDLGVDKPAESGTFPVVPGSKVLYNGPLGQLAIPETEEASCELGRGTKWCTAARENNMFDYYSEEAPLYVWRDKNGEKYQFHFGPEPQLMDSRDRELSKEKVAAFRKHPVLSKMFKMAEAEALSSPGRAASYAATVIHGRWPEAEPVIMTEPGAAASYARTALRRPWPEAEPVIMQSPASAAFYVTHVLKRRWPEAEPVIMKDPHIAAFYAKDVLKRRWPEAEPDIAKHPYAAYVYAVDVMDRPWPEAEPAIKQNARFWKEYKDLLDIK